MNGADHLDGEVLQLVSALVVEGGLRVAEGVVLSV